MSNYGRWREMEEQRFEAWWKWFIARGWLFRYSGFPMQPERIEPRDAGEIEMAHNAALNAWMKAKEREAPDD